MKKLLLVFISVFIISSCIDPFSAFEFGKHEPGTGSFLLTINNNTGRTILPTVVQDMFSSYTLEFTPVGITSNTSFSISRTNENLSVPVLLNVGTWNLSVTAWLLDEDGNPLLAAQGSLNNIVIANGQNVTNNVILKPITNSGMGTFSWDIDYPENVVSANMKIILLDETNGIQEKIFYFAGNDETLTDKINSTSLESGFYRVIFTLEDDQGKTAIRSDILHIYRNMESVFSFIFTENLFLKDTLTVILSSWNKGYSQWKLFDNDITAAHFILANIEGVFDDNFDAVADWFEKKIKISAVNLNELKVLTDFALIGIAGNDKDFRNSSDYIDRPSAEAAISALAANGTSVTFDWEKFTSVNVLIHDQFTVQIIFNGEILPPFIGIEIASLPKKTNYLLGEEIDLTGLLVNNIYEGNVKRPTSNIFVNKNIFTPSNVTFKTNYLFESGTYTITVFNSGTSIILAIESDLNFIGEWLPGGPYYVNDIVTFNELSYICILDNTGATNPEASIIIGHNRWAILNTSISSSFEITVSNELINTGLPIIYIETQDEAQIDSREIYRNINFKLTSDNPSHNLEKTGFRDEIRGRGNSTWTYPKKPYRIRFAEETSLLGMIPSRNWVLLADWRDPTLLVNSIALELGYRFGHPFTCNAVHVEVVINGEYHGTYVLTEHMRVGEGRVDIDRINGYLVELDGKYDEDPKFRTEKLDIPVMIKYPDLGTNVNHPGYDFVKESLSEFDSLLFDPNFPNNNYRDIIDIDSLVDFLMIHEIINHHETIAPGSIYLYKDGSDKIKMGPLWDFDSGYGIINMGRDSATARLIDWRNVDWMAPYNKAFFFARFYEEDPVFLAKYKARWNEKLPEILGIIQFIDRMNSQLEISQTLNNIRWSGHSSVDRTRIKNWLIRRIEYLTKEINNTPAGSDSLEGKLLILQAYGSSATAAGASHSFIELYNTTTTPINLNGISLYYAEGHRRNDADYSATADKPWNRIPLSGIIPARSSFLIMGSRESSTAARYQIPDNFGDINNPNFTLGNRSFKAALIRDNNFALSQNPFNIDGEGIMFPGYIDMIGSRNEAPNDAGTNNFDKILGFEVAPARNSASEAVRRKNLIDTNNNSVDFVSIRYASDGITNEELAVRGPRNSRSGSWNPFQTPANPPVSPPVPTGNKHLILQVGAATDGNINRSFVELYNNADTPLDLTGYSLHYAAGTQNPAATEDGTWQMINFTQEITDPAKRIIPPRHSFLILGEAQVPEPGLTPALTFEDVYGDLYLSNFHISNRSYKVVLMNNTTALTVQNPFGLDGLANISSGKSAGFVDMLGAINSPGTDKINGFEYLPFDNLSKQVGVRRTSLIDTDNNKADFARATFAGASLENFERLRPKNLAYGAWDPITGIKGDEEPPPTPPVSTSIIILQANRPGNDNGGSGGFPSALVELYNVTDASINLTTGNYYLHIGDAENWLIAIKLEGSIPSKSSFLVVSSTSHNASTILQSGGAAIHANALPAGRARLPAADQTADFNFGTANHWKVILMKDQPTLTVNNPFTDPSLFANYVDMLGAGSPNALEGTLGAETSQPQGPRRRSLIDTNDNRANFTQADYRGHWLGTARLPNADLHKFWPRNAIMGTWDPIAGTPVLHPTVISPITGEIEFPLTP